ncbi:MAG: F0F1 ATP synthase subunit delta [Hyphomicrobiales bacterium]|nr:F0F1 ATP synthase subunit delta [Hyphomicrobiales bacterium]
MTGEDATVSGVAGRYATALFELARDANVVDAVKGDLDAFASMVDSNPDLNRLVRSPVFTSEEQAKALDALLGRAGITGIAANFLKVVAANRRLFSVREMVRNYNALAARHKGEIRAEVTAADKLSAARLAEIKSALSSATGKDVQVDVTVDPSIIGGLIVKLGSRMVDSSLRTKLNAIRFAMKEAR